MEIAAHKNSKRANRVKNLQSEESVVISGHTNIVSGIALTPRENAPSTTKISKNIYRALTAVCVIIIAVSGVFVAQWLYQFVRHRSMANSIAEAYAGINADGNSLDYYLTDEFIYDSETGESNASNGYTLSERERLLAAEEVGRRRFAPLLAINAHFRGMIIIEGLGISEPYVHYSDNEKYLNTDFNGNRSSYGTIFLSRDNDRLLTDKNVVMFGHHMRTQEMFTPLVKYKNLDTVASANTIVLDSLTGRTVWLVFAAYTCEPDYGYIDTQVTGDSFEELLGEIMMRSIFITDIDISADDQILTLSTCDYAFEDARFAVHARKLRPGESIPEVVEVSANPSPKPYNVPMQQPLGDAAVRNAGVMRHISSGRMYFYYAGASGFEWYTGNLWQVQGPYNCYSANITTDGYLSAVMLPNRQTLIAVDRLNGEKGISLFISNLPQGRFAPVKDTPITRQGEDARWPLLYTDDDITFLMYTVTDEDGARDYILRAELDKDGTLYELQQLASFPEGSGVRAAGMVNVDGCPLLIYHDTVNKRLYGKYIGIDPLTGTEQEPYMLTSFGETDADRITFYGGLTDDGIRVISERGGRMTSGMVDVSYIPVPDWLQAWQPPVLPPPPPMTYVTDAASAGETADDNSFDNAEGEGGISENEAEPDENGDNATDEDIDADTGEQDDELHDPDAIQDGAVAVVSVPRVVVGGRAYLLSTYSVNGYNYFNLRDIAYVLKGTTAAFEVGYENGVITITKGEDYTPAGGELAARPHGDRDAVPTTLTINIDGVPRTFNAYYIEDNNYVGIRDLASAIGLKVEVQEGVIVIQLPPPPPPPPPVPVDEEPEDQEEPEEAPDVDTSEIPSEFVPQESQESQEAY